MSDLKSFLKIKAAIRLASSHNKIATIIRKGDEDNGAIYVKIRRNDQKCKLRSRVIGDNGYYNWVSLIRDDWIEEELIDKMLEKEVKFDPDLWILEIETNLFWNPLEEGF